LREADHTVEFQRFEGARSMSLTAAAFAFQTFHPRLLQVSPANTRFQAGQILARMRAYPRRIDQQIARLRVGTRG
jgi:hypothetical protein